MRKTNQIISLKESNHQIHDVHSYMQQSLQRNQKKQRMEQDREIHLATLAERNRIAREIHDNVGHMLSRSILQLGAILTINKNETLDEPLSNLKDTLNTAMTSIRESVHDLRDESLDLELMILNMTKEFPNLDVKLDYDMSNHASKDIKYCFLAILKEAMTNTIKHSNGNAMEITIREHPALYQLLVQDNGTSNFSQTNDINSNHGMGLDNMRERVTALGGTIHITSDNGFRIFIIIQKPR
ncbi:MAG: two-component sensor histidine kinase [Clostridiales bacterium]|nr:two-component sensor histidine kinase [Clostridiales bacterium]